MSQFITEDDLRQMLKEEAERGQRVEIYHDDLREVLASPAGIRVLRHWLDACRVFGFLSAGGERTIQNAALADYGHARMLEITEASPEALMRILLAGLRDASGGDVSGEDVSGGADGQTRGFAPLSSQGAESA